MKKVYFIILFLPIAFAIYFLNYDNFKETIDEEINVISKNEKESYFDLQLQETNFPDEIQVRIKKDIKNKIIPEEALKMFTLELNPIRSSTLNDINYLKKGNSARKKEDWDRKTAGYKIPDNQWDKMIKKYSEKRDPNNKQELSIKSSALLDMGVTKLMRKDLKKAEHAFLTVINKFSNSEIESKARIFLIETLKQQNRIPEATRVIQASYEKYGDNDHYVALLDSFKIEFTKTIISQTMKKRESSQTNQHQQTKKHLQLSRGQSTKANQTKKFFPGDINHDGIISEKDSLCAYELSLSICPTSCGKDCDFELCDINGDNKCTNSDAICIYNKALGLPCLDESLPGDMDKDGVLTDSDVLCAHELSLSICPTSCGKSCNIKLCDVNADNRCTDEDVICIYHRSLDLKCP